MAKLKIAELGEDVLRRRADEVPGPDAELDRLIDDMFETMYDAGGIGLAAPQIGVSRRVIVVDVKEEGSEPFVLLNPRIVEKSERREKGEEGCLSIPGISGVVDRPAEIVVEGLDRAGKPVRMEAGELLARCLQHEVDHLDGVLFIDHLGPLKRNMLLKKWKKRT
ncbi:MAG TPA: peptide deformylase [Longimicrobiaceae bacterium]|jgi:peptide deformylase|nr:peptide deformylase [Longimicrobiaceae bacterium]